MTNKTPVLFLFYFAAVACLMTGCYTIGMLFYKDFRSETAYRSSGSNKNYFVIEGVTQAQCGCSDIVVKNYKNKKIEFKFYYGGGLFTPTKYVYQYNGSKIDTLVYKPVSTDNFTVPLDSLDKVILKRIDTLIANRPKGSGLAYPVKKSVYKGFVRETRKTTSHY